MGLRIVQLANFYGPRSGGLRTAVHQLGAGYVARGHEVALVVPGRRRADEVLDGGARRITLPAPVIPGSGGYRLLDPYRAERLLDRLGTDRIEVSDRLTLRRLGLWAAQRGVPSVVISHERLDRLLGQVDLPPSLARRLADWSNTRLAAHFDNVVCTTEFTRAARRAEVASLLATAGLVLAPGPHETFGLAALKALACGTPVVVSRSSALAEIIWPECGRAVADCAESFASGVRELLAVQRPVLRAAARRRAEQFTWSAAVDGILAALRAS